MTSNPVSDTFLQIQIANPSTVVNLVLARYDEADAIN